MDDVKYMRRKLRSVNPVHSFLQRVFLNEKLNNWVGYFLVACLAGTFGFLTSKDYGVGVALIGTVLGIFIVFICLLSTEFGLYIIVAYAFLAYHLSRFLFNDDFPVGVVTDVLIGVTFIGLFIGNNNLKQSTIQFFRSRPIIYLFIIFIFLCLELFNPSAHSFQGWFQIIRKVLDSLLLIYIAYNVFTDFKKIRRFLKVLFLFATLAGLYGCIQQWHGLFGFEQRWVSSDLVRFDLIFILGNFRKFSFMSGPAEFGIIMAAAALLFIIIGIFEKKPFNKYILLAGSLFMILGMSYSGTRTANAMIVGGSIMFIILTFNKKVTMIFTFFAVLTYLFLMYAPIYNNLTLLRFRTSFSGKEDQSFKVREENRAAIRPYIYSHPFGGGLSTTGLNGKLYNPGHPLAGFPPDSGYLNKALETGWIGLAMSCILYLVTLLYAIQGYFKAKNNKIKILFAAISAFLFSFYIGELVQEAVGQFTNMVVYYPVVAILVRLRYLSEKTATEDL